MTMSLEQAMALPERQRFSLKCMRDDGTEPEVVFRRPKLVEWKGYYNALGQSTTEFSLLCAGEALAKSCCLTHGAQDLAPMFEENFGFLKLVTRVFLIKWARYDGLDEKKATSPTPQT